MKGMNFSIDIVWIKGNEIVEITENIPTVTTGTPDKELILYLPTSPIDYVLEIGAGVAKEKSIEIGSTVQIPKLEK